MRKDASLSELGTAETKLLYTLQWLLLSAVEECADADQEKPRRPGHKRYLYPVTSLQVTLTH